MFPFRRLAVWHRAHRLGVATLAERNLDRSAAGRSIAGQLRRAAISVSANIAEGAGSSSHALFARYLGIAVASAHETECLISAVADARLLDQTICDDWLREIGEIRAMLIVLRRRVRADPRGRSHP